VSLRICSRDTGVTSLHRLSNFEFRFSIERTAPLCSLTAHGARHRTIGNRQSKIGNVTACQTVVFGAAVERDENEARLRFTPAWQPFVSRCAPKRGWRRGQESNLPRLLRTDNGFEDREGHQAPVTLRKQEENAQPASALDGLRRGERPTPNSECFRERAAQRSTLKARADRPSGAELRMFSRAGNPTPNTESRKSAGCFLRNSMFDVRCSTFDVCSGVEWRASKEKRARLFRLLDRANDLIEIGPVPRLEFGMEQFAINLDLERAAAGRDESEGFDPITEIENFCRQTDGLWRVVSDHAVFNRHFGFHSSSFPGPWYESVESRSRR
jgi:hypothetical protein